MRPIKHLSNKEKFMLQLIKKELTDCQTIEEIELLETILDELMMSSIRRFKNKQAIKEREKKVVSE